MDSGAVSWKYRISADGTNWSSWQWGDSTSAYCPGIDTFAVRFSKRIDIGYDAKQNYSRFYMYPTLSTCEGIWDEGLGNNADLNRDCHIDFLDFMEFAGSWLDCFDPADSNCL